MAWGRFRTFYLWPFRLLVRTLGFHGKFVWILTYTLDGEFLGQTQHSLKQNRLEQLAFNFCMENKDKNISLWWRS